MPTLNDLKWETRFTDTFPADPLRENKTRPVERILYSDVQPTAVSAPTLTAWSESLANDLQITRPNENDDASLRILAGNLVLPTMRPYAARYGGHQFGHWAGQLGDGRAITLGNVKSDQLGHLEFQLKGAGPTPYSRRADGRAVLRSSVREYLCSEAMHFLGIPTTRALSLVTTGDLVMRDLFYDGNAALEPGAIVCRVSPSFLRFGNFEILAAAGEVDLLKKLADFLIGEHIPAADYGELLDEIGRRTARLMADWMRVGFVHGVINTDNLSVLGLTIDYGPYGWLEPYDPDWTPNTTDATGRRYRFENQPGIGYWNFAKLCEAFHPLVQDESRLRQSLAVYKKTFEDTYTQILADKLGMASLANADDEEWIEKLFELMKAARADFTQFFRSLAHFNAASDNLQSEFELKIIPTFYSSNQTEAHSYGVWQNWIESYAGRIRADRQDSVARRLAMNLVNPNFILRNYLAQTAIEALGRGDGQPLERLQLALQRPYADDIDADLIAKRPAWAENSPGCSALSCSS